MLSVQSNKWRKTQINESLNQQLSIIIFVFFGLAFNQSGIDTDIFRNFKMQTLTIFLLNIMDMLFVDCVAQRMPTTATAAMAAATGTMTTLVAFVEECHLFILQPLDTMRSFEGMYHIYPC